MVPTPKRATIAPDTMRFLSPSEKIVRKYNAVCAELPGLAGANGLRLAKMIVSDDQAPILVDMTGIPSRPSYAALIESDRGRVVEGEWRNYEIMRDNLSDDQIDDLNQWCAEMDN